MAATKVESLTNPRDSLPNTYTSVTAREVDFVTPVSYTHLSLPLCIKQKIFFLLRPAPRRSQYRAYLLFLWEREPCSRLPITRPERILVQLQNG